MIPAYLPPSSDQRQFTQRARRLFEATVGAQPGWSRTYREKIQSTYAHLVPRGSRVLELGCGDGALLAALQPTWGVGVDFSDTALAAARCAHPQIEFVAADVQELELGDQVFDCIVVSDLVNDLWDVQELLNRLQRYCGPSTRLILNFSSQLWNLPLKAAMGLVTPDLTPNWLTRHDLSNLLEITGYEPLRQWEEVMMPLPLPLISAFCNRYLVRLFPFRHLAMTNFMLARPVRPAVQIEPVVSVIVPARNEAGHIEELLARIPEMGQKTEIIFVEGHSGDETYAVIERAIAAHPGRCCQLLRQPGCGKGDAVRAGFAAAHGEILMILDADITVPPEDLTRFYTLLTHNTAEFVNGVRLVYPMEDKAMNLVNLIANKFFAGAFSWLLGQPVRDTLCGTKALWKRDYLKIAASRAEIGLSDPFGDFDLLFGAARLGLKIRDVPVRYRARRYGETNISRWTHGWLLLKMVFFAARRFKFL